MTTTQDSLFATVCGVGTCESQATKGGLMCSVHWERVPDALKYKLALARQDVQRAGSAAAKGEALRKFDVARQACVEAVAR
jgi:hypothetical protein